MKKPVIFLMFLLGGCLSACQGLSFFADPTPVVVPTRLVLPSDTPTSPPPTVEVHSLPTATFTPSPSPTPTLSPTRTGKYTGRAKGIELNEQTGAVDPGKLKADFGVVYGGEGWDGAAPNYKANIRALYQANIPVIFLWDILLPEDLDASRPERSYPPEAEEPNVSAIIRSVQDKPIDAIIIRFLDKKTPDGRTFTQVWMANYIKWMINAVHNQTGKPVYVMTSRQFIASFDEAPELNYAVSGIESMCSWKPAMPEDVTQPADWNNFPFPEDDYSPEYISENYRLNFINYARLAWSFDGIEGPSTPLWMYSDNAAQLKIDLNYQEHPSSIKTNQ
ncbi:MAG: hypothetical protein LWX83_08265 [Anaerolineae bacterium]|nr:hypothetical protein [Anaerolineae bacterium]